MGSNGAPFVDVFVVSDVHAGSIFGLWPPDFKLADGSVYRLNKGQDYLWKCWLHLRDRLTVAIDTKSINPAAVVFLGDGIDGRQEAQRATEAVTVRLSDQKEAFVAAMQCLLEPFKGLPVYGIAGTEYHDQRSADTLEDALKDLNAESYEGIGSGRYCHEILDLDVFGKVINFSHHIPALTGLYRATAIDREAIWSALAGEEGKSPKADVLVRGHVHYFVHVEHESKHGVIVPAWQLQTRFMRKRSVYRMLPNLGAVIIRVFKEEAWHDDKIQIYKFIYPLPPYRPTKLRLAEA